MQVFSSAATSGNVFPRSPVCFLLLIVSLIGTGLGSGASLSAGELPALPARNGTVRIPAQEWRYRPGPREVKVYLYYPQGELRQVTRQTGLMLSLHNWGGTGAIGTADPQQLADRYNVVTICVDYLQSGRELSKGPEPYDFGYLQALDALRALWFTGDGLDRAGIAYDRQRIFSTGGSGGGNVTLMVNKLAPRTFTCIIDMCGMARLSDDIAYNLPGGSSLNARYSADPDSPHFLTPDEQQLRDVGDPAQLAVARKLGNTCKVIVVHGTTDTSCLVEDAQRMVENMRKAGFDVEGHFITDQDLDGKALKTTGHALGNRTLIVFRKGDAYLLPDSPQTLRRKTKTDFELREEVRYPTAGGAFVISYKAGFPVGRFEKK
jgi:predicted esterase